MLDITYIHQSLVGNFKRNWKREIDANNIGIGSRDATMKKDEIIEMCNYGIEQINKKTLWKKIQLTNTSF